MSPVDWSQTCIACQYCCTYVALEIDTPTTDADFDYVRWYLAHKRINIYLDEDDCWYFLVNTECENLTPAGCGIYEKRFNICRDYEATTCEMTVGQPSEKVLFRTVADFDRWLEFNRARLAVTAARKNAKPGRSGTRSRQGSSGDAVGHHNPGPFGKRRRKPTPVA